MKIASKFFQDTLGFQNADDLGECLKAYHLLFVWMMNVSSRWPSIWGKPMEEYKTIMKSQDLHTVHPRENIIGIILDEL